MPAMNVNVNDLVAAALPPSSSPSSKKKRPRVAVVRDNTPAPSPFDSSFLSDDFPRDPPHVFVAAEGAASRDDLDPALLAGWDAEGFVVEVLPSASSSSSSKKFSASLEALSHRRWMPCQTFAIVAYGAPAAACLEHYSSADLTHDSGMRLGCLVAYYPPRMPDLATARFPANVRVCVHLAAGSRVGVVRTPQMLGIQGRKHASRKSVVVDKGLGPAGALVPTTSKNIRAYAYDGVDPGFAEPDALPVEAGGDDDDGGSPSSSSSSSPPPPYDPACAELAWRRTIATVRRALCNSVSRHDLELVVDQNEHARFCAPDLERALATYAPDAAVTHVPTLTGVSSATDEGVREFFARHYFPPPPSLRATLVSRTASPGAGTLVDELHVSLRHTRAVPWLLPGVAPTKRRVEVVLVLSFALRAGRIVRERVYWDQASVLAQVGLLDVARGGLPIVDATAARRVVLGGDEEGNDGEADNRLIYAGGRGRGKKAGGGKKGKGSGQVETAAQEEDGDDDDGKETVQEEEDDNGRKDDVDNDELGEIRDEDEEEEEGEEHSEGGSVDRNNDDGDEGKERDVGGEQETSHDAEEETSPAPPRLPRHPNQASVQDSSDAGE
jgi:dienelactone hydrolase